MKSVTERAMESEERRQVLRWHGHEMKEMAQCEFTGFAQVWDAMHMHQETKRTIEAWSL